MNTYNFLFTLFFSLAAAVAGGLLFSTKGTPIENVFIGAGLVGIILFAFMAGMMQAMINRQEVRQRGVRRAEQVTQRGKGFDNGFRVAQEIQEYDG